ncbi:conserved Plasmodium protein, unknown function [Plasmodium chabaudi chabaudi]|uniref:Histone chaperone domain-containing protein n=1 Tax=Plasmodium chabaudi chabaudi TaxID=31271 RepID=A0A4V0K515_PLACU|nr:conserved Plasmodium protein, unknown function [Plasmodium chabaudi chabaudi]VTZ67970.1 conserved Plasmodium protein, unknown function [Plasmodium chabaudi chabaudi]|eukprot:XP_016653571.1 conserved Plasmodium protein, unknown function [Plasmodium chabaudi chabaudi]
MDVPNEVEKIKEVLDKILPERDLNLVTIKSVRKDVADYLEVDESYFTDNKEKKAILKDILKDKLLKLYNEQQGKKEEEDDESTKTKSSNESDDEYKQKKHNQSNKSIKSDSKNNKKRKMSSDDFNTPSSKNAKKEKKNGNKKDDNSDNDNENDELKPKSRKKSSGSITEKNIHTIKKEKLRKIVLDLKIGPTIFKDLNKENDEEYNKKLEEKIIAFCEKKEICSEKNRLPNPSEIQEYAKQLKLKEELDGIDLSNILDSGTRSRRRTPTAYVSKIVEGSEEEEEDEEDDEEDDDEEENDDDDEDDEENDEEDEEEDDEEEEEEEDEDEEEYEEEDDDDDDDD